MTSFWIMTGALAVAVAGLLALALLRGRRGLGPSEAFDMQVYRDQLAEVSRDLERGVISPEDAERLKTEVSRRLLAADAKMRGEVSQDSQPRALGRGMGALMALVLVGGAFGLYWRLGAPGYGDLGLQDRIAQAETFRLERPDQATVEADIPVTAAPDVTEDYLALVERLRGVVAERPDDLQGLTFLARAEAALGNYIAAYKAQERIIAVKGDQASARDYADLADMMILAAGGYVSPEAERALEAALARDGGNGVARYYAGLMMAQTGRPDAAFRLWETLLAEGPPDAPWIAPVREQIEEMAFRAGAVNFVLPPVQTAPGPTADDVEAAQDMTPEERQEMIAGMVARLSDRLATEGGPPEDWARLIGALSVLGNEAQAIAIWNNAQAVFADTPEALAIVRDGARGAGLVP